MVKSFTALPPLHRILMAATLIATVAGSIACEEAVLRRPPEVSDVYTQNVAASVDILWMIDNTPTMIEEHEALAASFNSFIAQLDSSAVNYRVGVITADANERGVLRTGAANKAIHQAAGVHWPHPEPTYDIPYITPETEDPQAAFTQMVAVGIWGAWKEQGMETTTMALGIGPGWNGLSQPNPPSANQDFLRHDAALFIIMVSDEDDMSYGPVQYYYRAISSYKGRGNDGRISVSAIVGPPPQPGVEDDPGGCHEADRGSAVWGARYIELASLTGGVATSICEDFNESLATLSYAAAGLSQKFGPLSRPHNPMARIICDDAYNDRPFCVKVNEVPVPYGRPNGWELLEEQVGGVTQSYIFFYGDAVPPPQSKISITYLAAGASL